MTTQLINPHDCMFIQSRAEVNFSIVDEYAALMEMETIFEPVKGMIDENSQIYIWDGYHRGEAAKKSGTFLHADLVNGTRADAEWQALSANITHGLRRTQKDIERVVKAALKLKSDSSDRDLGRHCGVHHSTISKYRKELEASGEIRQIDTRTVKRNGTAYQMQTERQLEIPMSDQDEAEEDTSFKKRLAMCRETIGKCYRTKERHVFKVTEVNEVLAKVRGQGYTATQAFTENCELEDLQYGLPESMWNEYDRKWHKKDIAEDIELDDEEPVDESDPCALCKSAHPGCDQCCNTCTARCNGSQYCSLRPLDVQIEEEQKRIHTNMCTHMEEHQAEPQAQGSIFYTCYFCGQILPDGQAYVGYGKQKCVRGVICLICASKAAIFLSRQDDSMTHSVFAFRILDREKIMFQGLRLFRVEEHTLTLKEFTPAKSTTMEGVDPAMMGSWKHVELFETKAALKRRITELEKDKLIIFENYL